MTTQKEIAVLDINKLQLIDSAKPEYYYLVPKTYLMGLRTKIEKTPLKPELPELKEFAIWQRLIEAKHAFVVENDLGSTDIYKIRATETGDNFKWPYTNLP